MRVAVIGAGPSGLVTLKYLLAARDALGTKPIEAKLFESEPSIGGTFFSRTYEDAELVSSKQLTTFSDFRIPSEGDFLSAGRYLQYLKDYCTHFRLWPHINLLSTVKSLNKRRSGDYSLAYTLQNGLHTWECDAVAICSGLHVLPNIPHIDGIDRIPVRLHSSEFKKRTQFDVGKTVLILGSGETASDLGYLAVTSPTEKVVLCHRDGFHLAPKTNPEPRIIGMALRKTAGPPPIPIDVSRASLFDTAYVHPWLRKSIALWTYYDYYVGWILWMSWGTFHGLDQWIAGKPTGWSTSQIFFNKSSKISPYINNAWKPRQPQSFPQYLRSLFIRTPYIDTKGRCVDVAPWPERINEDGRVVFKDNGRPEYLRMKEKVVKPDMVIYCTGYRQEFPFLQSQHHNANVRDIWNRDDPNVGFIGFIRPSLGAIPPLAEMQAQLWVLNLVAPERVNRLDPDDEPHYRLITPKSARVRYGIDHESYIYQLALDMNSAPSLSQILSLACDGPRHQLWRLPLVWALGANFNTKFRLYGPWQWDGAPEILVDELWETITRRPIFFGHITLSLVPMLIFGPISLLVYLYATLLELLKWVMHMKPEDYVLQKEDIPR
ncbi:uncharacterized protein BCR38DRAFT_353799 [Pseudomassariella vexata]|uniref:Dimethylaniline monooxygenase n=1 Tax=Pseudomassariella vexata TaxID=1141098 RepID=A0A1Y2DF68_9PEZI|nr:uncharacterized protein BCR38DRAFT_353799 [Pseudomassariella vexata]ORY57754.1 hypothetical protein BCR38DRAFT_353799 [Pseudomassariella vexata]